MTKLGCLHIGGEMNNRLIITIRALLLITVYGCSTTPGDASYRGNHYPQAANLYQKGAEQGDPMAALKLGLMLSGGEVSTELYGTAAHWYKRACELGSLPGCHNIGYSYEYGKNGVEKNYEEARIWYTKAAEKGYPQSQYNLSTLYSNMYLTPTDDVEGYKWMLIARKSAEMCIDVPICQWILDDPPGHEKKFRERMPAEQLSKAKVLADDWQPVK